LQGLKIFCIIFIFGQNTMHELCDVEKNHQELTTEGTEHTEKNQDMFATDLHRLARLRVFHAEARSTRGRIFDAEIKKSCRLFF
jgi:hypothetical protein